MTQLSQDRAKQLFNKGGFLVLEDLPAGSTFGVDGSAWAIGERFKVTETRNRSEQAERSCRG
jgi:hypothetical protein